MGIFGIKRRKAHAWALDVERGRRIKKAHQEEAARRKSEAKTKKEEAELKRKTEKMKAEASYYKAKAEKKKAKRAASFQWPAVKTPKVKVRKKRQGGKLSRKSRIRLI